MDKINLSGADMGTYFFDQNPTPMILFDQESLDIQKVNEAAVKQYGYPQNEFESLNIKQIGPQEDIPILMRGLDETTHNHAHTYRHLTREGELIYVEVDSKPLELDGQNMQLAVLHDVTERVNAKIRSQQAENLARLGWWTYEVKKDQIHWSEKLFDILSVDRENFEATLDGFFSLLYPEDRVKLKNILNRVQQSDQAIDYTLRALNSNEEVTHLKCKAQGIFDNENNLLRINGVAQDITEKVQTEKDLNKRTQAIASSMDGISILNENGEFIYMNQAQADIYGYNSPEELLGKTWQILYRDNDSAFFEKNVFPQIEQKGWWRGEAEGKRKDGTIFPQEVSLSTTTDEGLICIVRDITIRKKHEQNTIQALEEKETLLEEIHHRVKNNLAVVTSILELQKFEPLESVENLIEDIQSRIQSIGTVHEKLYQSATLSDVDVSEYIEDFSELVSESFNSAQKNITITKNLQQYKLDTRRAVPLGLIINELLSNAFKHGFSDIHNGRIRIKLEVNNKEVVLTVADNGNPIPKNFSFDDSQSMGMSIIKTLTSQLEGTYSVKQNGWTTFQIRFPKVVTTN